MEGLGRELTHTRRVTHPNPGTEAPAPGTLPDLARHVSLFIWLLMCVPHLMSSLNVVKRASVSLSARWLQRVSHPREAAAGGFDLATGVAGSLGTLRMPPAPAGEAGVWGLTPSPVHRGRMG